MRLLFLLHSVQILFTPFLFTPFLFTPFLYYLSLIFSPVFVCYPNFFACILMNYLCCGRRGRGPWPPKFPKWSDLWKNAIFRHKIFGLSLLVKIKSSEFYRKIFELAPLLYRCNDASVYMLWNFELKLNNIFVVLTSSP